MEKEIAELIDWPVPWDTGAPEPFVIAGEGRLFLVYYAQNVLPSYDKAMVKILCKDGAKNRMALVEFLSWLDFKFGGPDENSIGDPGYFNGLKPYHAYVINNSKWLSNLKQGVSFKGDSESFNWEKYRHFVLGFHDESFECIAKSYSIEVYSADDGDVREIAYDRLIGTEWWMKTSKSDFRCPKCNMYLGKHVYAAYCMNCGASLSLR